MNRRPVPEAAVRDEGSYEILSAWIAEGKLHCSLRIGMYQNSKIDEPYAWGIIIADLTRHVANALAQLDENHRDIGKTIETIQESYIKEILRPTSDQQGDFVD